MKKFLVALFVILWPSLAPAAQRVWISEFVASKVQVTATPIAQLPSLLNQLPFDLSTGPKASAPFASTTRYIRIVCEVKCAINATGVTATPNDILLPALMPEYFGVVPGGTINAIVVP